MLFRSNIHDKDRDNDEEYIPEKDDGIQSDDTSEVHNSPKHINCLLFSLHIPFYESH